jgi:hypothetical protein
MNEIFSSKSTEEEENLEYPKEEFAVEEKNF